MSHTSSRRRLFAASFLAALVATMALLAAAKVDAQWKTGPAFTQQLATPVSLTWGSNPLRTALTRLAETQQMAILVDRRLDPEQKLDFQAAGVPLEQVLRELAGRYGNGIGVVGPVIYFGPKETAERLATLAALRQEQIQQLPPEVRRRWTVAATLTWQELDTPREISARVAEQAGVRLIGGEKIPHDLWGAAELPPLTLVDKLTLLWAGFDLAPELSPDGSAVRPIPLPVDVSVTRSYPAGAKAGELANQLASRFPGAHLRAEGGQLQVRGRIEDHTAIARALRGEPVRVAAPPKTTSRQVYTLRVDNQPIGGVLPALGRQLGLEVEFDPALRDRLGELVSFRVENVSREELLQAAVSAAKLRYTLDGSKLRVMSSE